MLNVGLTWLTKIGYFYYGEPSGTERNFEQKLAKDAKIRVSKIKISKSVGDVRNASIVLFLRGSWNPFWRIPAFAQVVDIMHGVLSVNSPRLTNLGV